MRFRLDSKYVDNATRDAWTKQELADEQVVVHFVLQQAHEYFTPVLFPVCTGTVVDAFREGDIFLVEFIVGDVLTLTAPEPDPGDPHKEMYPARTAAYRQALEKYGLPLPYNRFAIRWIEMSSSGQQQRRGASPERSGRYQRYSGSRPVTYLERKPLPRPARLRAPPQPWSREPWASNAKSHSYRLTAGEEYELEFLQAQPGQYSHVNSDECCAGRDDSSADWTYSALDWVTVRREVYPHGGDGNDERGQVHDHWSASG